MRSIIGPTVVAAVTTVLATAGASAQIVFTDVTADAGIALEDSLTESVAWGDYDNDGDDDLYLTVNGPNHLFRNDGRGRFSDVTDEARVGNGGFSVGTAFGDLDNHGDLDLVVTADAGVPNRLWRNDSVTGHRWLGLRLHGTRSNRSAIGARVIVTTADGSHIQEVSDGAGRGSQNSLLLVFGLGTAAVVEELTVRWPSGHVRTLRNLPVDRYIALTERSTSRRRSPARRGSFLENAKLRRSEVSSDQ